MAYTGYTISVLDVKVGDDVIGTIPFADKDSCARFQMWWAGKETRSKDVMRSGVKLADGIVTAGSTSDKQRLEAMLYLGIPDVEDEDAVGGLSFTPREIRYDTVDVFFGANRASRAKSLSEKARSLSDLTSLKDDLSKLTPAEKAEFFKLLTK